MYSQYKILNDKGIEVQVGDVMLQNSMPWFSASKQRQTFDLSFPIEVQNQSLDTILLDQDTIYAYIGINILRLNGIHFDKIYSDQYLNYQYKKFATGDELKILPLFEGALTFHLSSEKRFSYSEYKNSFLNDTLMLHIGRKSFLLERLSFNQSKRLFER